MSDIGNKAVFSKNIKYYIEKSGKNRRELAEIWGFPYSTVTDWVNGNKYPRIDRIEIMADYFGILKSDLIEDKSITDPNRKRIFSENLVYYVANSPKTRKKISKEIGVEESIIDDWMLAKAYPNNDQIERLADFFKIQKSDLTEDESKHVKVDSPEDMREQILKTLGFTYEELMALGQNDKRQQLMALAGALSEEKLALILRIVHSVIVEDE